jgi:hypothetical protein
LENSGEISVCSYKVIELSPLKKEILVINQIIKLAQGEVSLAKTYWLFGVIGTSILSAPFAIVTQGGIPAILFVLIFCAYIIFINISIWRSADKYQGLKFWALLSKAFIILQVGAFFIGCALAIFIPNQDQVIQIEKINQSNTPTVNQLNSDISMAEVRKKIPELNGLSDESALNVIHQVYYPEMTKADLARRLGLTLEHISKPEKLGFIDLWRYQACQKDASNAPTIRGVNVGLTLCKEKFHQ